MKVVGLNDREYTWNLNKYETTQAKDRSSRSKFHLLARELIYETYPSYIVLEEVKLPGSTTNKASLYLDFFIPNLKLAFEVHGQQHYKFTPFFHKHRADFLLGQHRDRNKILWCENNEIDLVVLKYSESEDEWRTKIRC